MLFMNGKTVEADAAPSTKSLWGSVGDMFGFGPIIRMASDPAIVRETVAMMQAIGQSVSMLGRLEYKLDLLLRQAGQDVEAINAEFRRAVAAVPQIDGTLGTARPAVASPVVGDGNRGDPPSAGDLGGSGVTLGNPTGGN